MAPRLSTSQILARCASGLLVGQVLVVALDRLIGGPGPFVMFGL
ncbi:hypothetical protein [Sphingomonas citricola]|nr:hypothetical protein [Sphingomonas citricola]